MEEQNNIDTEVYHTDNQDLIPEQFSLPYHWDEQCHLILNDDFYLRSLSPEPELLEFPDSLNFDLQEEVVLEKEELFVIKDLACSESSGSTAGTIEAPESLPKRTKTLNDQLDFIMGTCQKHQSSQEKVSKRNRKTPQQVMILIEELGEVPRKITKKEIKAAAVKSGLSELQVYKWHYDRKCRLG